MIKSRIKKKNFSLVVVKKLKHELVGMIFIFFAVHVCPLQLQVALERRNLPEDGERGRGRWGKKRGLILIMEKRTVNFCSVFIY